MAKHIFYFIIRFIAFIALGSIFLTIGTVGLHEVGHLLFAKIYNCSSETMTLSPQNWFVETYCEEHKAAGVIMSGLILTTIFSSLIFVLSYGILRYIAGIIFAIGVIASSRDFMALNLHLIPIVLLNTCAYLLLGFCVIKVSLLYFRREFREKEIF